MFSRRSLLSFISFLGVRAERDDYKTRATGTLQGVPFLKGRSFVLRVWKLGSLEHRLLPSKEAIQRLVDVLSNLPETGDANIVWGPDIDVQSFQRSEGDIDIIAVDPRFVIVWTEKGIEIKNVENGE